MLIKVMVKSPIMTEPEEMYSTMHCSSDATADVFCCKLTCVFVTGNYCFLCHVSWYNAK